MQMLVGCSEYILVSLVRTLLRSHPSREEIKKIYIFGRPDRDGYYRVPGIAVVHQDEGVTRSFYDFMRKHESKAREAGIREAARITLATITPQLQAEIYAWSQNKESILYDIVQFALLPHDWRDHGPEGMARYTERTPFDLVFWTTFWSEHINWKELTTIAA